MVAGAALVMVASSLEAQRRPLALGLVRSPSTATARAPDDRWFGTDKLRHLGSSAAIQLMGYGMLRLAFPEGSRGGAASGAAVVTLAAGIGKELRDARGRGDPSARDLVWDVAGLGVGAVLSWAADRK